MGSPSLPASPARPPPAPDLTDQALRAQALAQRQKSMGGGALRQSFVAGGPRIASSPPSFLGGATSNSGAKSLLGQ